MSYTIKAFSGDDEMIETRETREEAETRYHEFQKQSCDAVYLYDPNNELVMSWQDSYLTYEVYQASCVYCGGSSPDGYCWNSPDGNHVMGDDF